MNGSDRKCTNRRILAIALLCAGSVAGQSGTRLYVQRFDNDNDDSLREQTIRLLKNHKGITIVANTNGADRILTGTNQTYVKGYLSRNPRVRYRNGDSRPVYGGYLSVELKDQQDETVWSYLVTPSRFGSEDIDKNLAGQIVNKLLQFLTNAGNAP